MSPLCDVGGGRQGDGVASPRIGKVGSSYTGYAEAAPPHSNRMHVHPSQISSAACSLAKGCSREHRPPDACLAHSDGVCLCSGERQREELWVDKYAPTAFAHLLSEEAINREVSPSLTHTQQHSNPGLQHIAA